MLTLAVPPDFDLPRAVCSYGYFVLAPNRWDVITHTLETIVRGEGDRAITVKVRAGRVDANADRSPSPGAPGGQGAPGARKSLRIDTPPSLSRADIALVKSQLTRILRIDEDLAPFHRLHRKAGRAGFGRLFRSASLLEDIIKTITACNVTWPQTVKMNALLCERVGTGGFPTPAQIAALRPSRLQAMCKLGYRAERIVRLARAVLDGRLDLDWFERPGHPTDEVFARLQEIHGIGPFAASNICQLLGRYDRLAIDSETYRHFRQTHGHPTPRDGPGLRRLHRVIEDYYAKFAPYQFLAYWFELWGSYESRFGEARAWAGSPPETAAKMK